MQDAGGVAVQEGDGDGGGGSPGEETGERMGCCGEEEEDAMQERVGG